MLKLCKGSRPNLRNIKLKGICTKKLELKCRPFFVKNLRKPSQDQKSRAEFSKNSGSKTSLWNQPKSLANTFYDAQGYWKIVYTPFRTLFTYFFSILLLTFFKFWVKMALQEPHAAYIWPCNFLLSRSWNFIFYFFERGNHALFRVYRFVGVIPSGCGSRAQNKSAGCPDFLPKSGRFKFGVEIHLRFLSDIPT